MKLAKLRTRSTEDCLSDLLHDALTVGELDEDRAAAAEAHVASCVRCAERQRTLRAHAVEFLRAHPSGESRHGSERGSRARRRAVWSGAALAAATVVMLWVHTPSGEGGTSDRSKGKSSEPSIGFYVRHGTAVRRGSSGERVAPHDALRFVVTSRAAYFWAVLSRDGAGRASLYFPDAKRAQRVDPGMERALDVSVVLDEVPGDEQLFALWCERPVELEPLLAALDRSVHEPAWPEGCRVRHLALRKDATQ